MQSARFRHRRRTITAGFNRQPAASDRNEAWRHAPYRLLVVSHAAQPSDIRWFGELAANQLLCVELAGPVHDCARLDAPAYDVLLVDLSTTDLEPLSRALTLRAKLRQPEIVFAMHERLDPAALALRELGLRFVVTSPQLATWLFEHVSALATLARARRAWSAASAQLQLPRQPYAEADTSAVSLHDAEQRFRETFLRGVLARTRSQAEAAAQARISPRELTHLMQAAAAQRGAETPWTRVALDAANAAPPEAQLSEPTV